MWGFGGRWYWGRKESGKGIVVVFACMLSEEKQLKTYLDLYSSLGWNSLVCHSQFLNLFFPDKATSLASEILNVLAKELKIKPCPVVFASFSGGPKACMYKVLQIIIEGKCEKHVNQDEYRQVRDCVCGQIYDSSPVDFTSDVGTRFLLHPAAPKMSWIANGISSSLDVLFLSRLESQRAEYWQTLYSSVSMGAPYLILFSEDDDLAPCQTICNFAQRLQDHGGDVKLVKWSNSSHLGHYRHYPNDYKAAVTELLGKAAIIYSRRIQQFEEEKMGLEGTQDKVVEPLGDPRRAPVGPNQSYRSVSIELNDHYFVTSSIGYHEDRDVGSVQDERLIPHSTPPSINALGVLGQVLFDVCVPNDVENWDIKSSSSTGRMPFSSARKHSHFNPFKCILRSRL